MKICSNCKLYYEDEARYCTQCAAILEQIEDSEDNNLSSNKRLKSNYNLFFLTLGGSLLLTWLLVAVFHLPIFFIGAVLPLLWYSKKK